ncbi:MalY/PatB family protein [Roseisalinus antarcticus]|uniref:Aminotransferase n=1 Tax=Roseisalinus antarcticus TaxID=254357 RepID=A0A1Y5SND5_9RHOB|nr:PatB family C-S lyase [Roseisalinus antarcticus]SLN44678.1 Cystathionine beta-lyase PatB [Roseisalinus antarcticus]
MDFDRLTVRRGTHSAKWSAAGKALGLTGEDALPMWVADMDFDTSPHILDAVTRLRDTAILGYFDGLDAVAGTIADWMRTRHGWAMDPDHALFVGGLGNGIATCLQAFTEPGDGIIIFTPVYLEFAKKVKNARREVHESPLILDSDGQFQIDFDALEAGMTGREKVMLLSSPHNPAGRLWTLEEQRRLAEFCARHDLVLMSDEVHQDLVFPGSEHLPMMVAAPEHADRIVMLTSASKTFNIAGTRVGTVTVPDPRLRETLRRTVAMLDIQPNIFGAFLTQAAYGPGGAEWVDSLTPYLAGNAALFREEIARIPGLRATPMQGTYLAWVDFTPLGMNFEEIRRRLVEDARIGGSPGPDFGTGGDCAMRFNIGTQRSRVAEAAARIQEAFSDVQ